LSSRVVGVVVLAHRQQKMAVVVALVDLELEPR
jgi:hypothetical protein